MNESGQKGQEKRESGKEERASEKQTSTRERAVQKARERENYRSLLQKSPIKEMIFCKETYNFRKETYNFLQRDL